MGVTQTAPVSIMRAVRSWAISSFPSSRWQITSPQPMESVPGCGDGGGGIRKGCCVACCAKPPRQSQGGIQGKTRHTNAHHNSVAWMRSLTPFQTASTSRRLPLARQGGGASSSTKPEGPHPASHHHHVPGRTPLSRRERAANMVAPPPPPLPVASLLGAGAGLVPCVGAWVRGGSWHEGRDGAGALRQ
jgi:hypothetical protein